MRKERLHVLYEQFPFLSGIMNAIQPNIDTTVVMITTMTEDFLRTTPVDESYNSSAGNSSHTERLFSVRRDVISEISLHPTQNHSTGYAYDKATYIEGQSFLSELISEESFDYLVWYVSSYNDYNRYSNSERITIIVPSKSISIREEWEKVLAEERQKLHKEIN